MLLVRVVRHLFPFKEFLDQTFDHFVDLSTLADRLFGTHDPQSISYRCIMACRQIERALTDGDAGAQTLWTDTVVECLEQAKNSTMDVGSWIDLWNSVASYLNASRNSWRKQEQVESADTLQVRMAQFWEYALELLGLPASVDADTDLAQARARATNVASIVHNYVGFLMTFPAPAYQVRGIEYGLQVVLPVREVVAQHRKDDNALRQTLQIAVRGIDRLLSESGEQHENLLEQLPDLLRRLRSTARAQALLDEGVKPDRRLDVRLMASLALGVLCLLEQTPDASPYGLRDVTAFIKMGEKAQATSVGPQPGPWIGKLELDHARARLQRLVSQSAS